MSPASQSSSQRFKRYRALRKRQHPSQRVTLQGDPGAGSRARRHRSFVGLFASFWRLLAGHRLVLAAALATLTCSTVLALAMPAAPKFAIDYILLDTPGPSGIPTDLARTFHLPSTRMGLLWVLCSALVVVSVLSVIVGMWGRWQVTRLTKRIQLIMRRKAFAHAAHLPLSRVHSLKSGGVASILREDAGGVGDLLFSMIFNPWRALIQLVGTMIILAIVDWRMLLGALLLLPTIWLTHRAWISRLRPMWRDIRMTRQHIDAHATEAFAGMRVVRGFARETGEAGRFIATNDFMVRQELLTWWLSRILEIVWMLLIPLASSAVLLYGGWRVIQGSLTIGDVMMFSTYLIMLLGPVESLVVSAAGIQNQLAGFDRVLDLIDEPVEFERDAATRTPVRIDPAQARGAIELDHVWFTYLGASDPVIRDVSLAVAPGETIALVGPSGSGKTTLSNLIARFFDPSQGTISLDGVPLPELDVRSYRSLLGIVEQDVFLFDGTVRENIGYARRGATDEQIVAAARAANAADFIDSLELGYDTIIGERGVRLSGGQKQRLAIARAILANPLILILDEATSSLDSESEALIQRSLAELMRGRTSFVIAHRLSTIRHADRIVVLEDGAVVETGSHDELLAQSGRYAHYLRLQIQAGDEETLANTDRA